MITCYFLLLPISGFTWIFNQYLCAAAECNNELRVIMTLTDMGLLLGLKYGVTQPALKDDLDGINPANLECNEYKLKKLESDR